MEGTLIGEDKDTGASAEGDRREGEPGSQRRRGGAGSGQGDRQSHGDSSGTRPGRRA